MSWDKYHCKDYQIPFPTTIHGSKSELKRLRYPENCTKHVSMLPEVITFDPTVLFWISLVFWKLDIQSFPKTPRSAQLKFIKAFKYTSCKVEFNQPSYWLYSVPNLLVFQQLVTLYLGGILVRVVSEIVWRNAQECARKTETRDWISQVTRGCKPPEAAHVPDMPEVEASC